MTNRRSRRRLAGKAEPLLRAPAEALLREAVAHANAGRAREAGEIARQLLATGKLPPKTAAEAWHIVGLSELLTGRPAGAADAISRALALDATQSQFHASQGTALKHLARPVDAAAAFRRAIEIEPTSVDAHNGLGTVYAMQGARDDASLAFERAIACNPKTPVPYLNLADLKIDQGQPERAIDVLKQALALMPGDQACWKKLGNVSRTLNRLDEARAAFERACQLDPKDLGSQLFRCMAELPVIYDTSAAIRVVRERYGAALAALHANVMAASDAQLATAAADVGIAKPFYLSYQGGNDRDLQVTYGRIVERIMRARFPEYGTVERSERAAGRRLRIGFAAAQLTLHSVTKLHGGAIRELDPARFDVHLYHFEPNHDAQTEALKARSRRYVQGHLPIGDWCRLIREDALDVLVHLEIGMHPYSVALAALRLAPVQCTIWSHPVTTGLSTIDYFLSSTLMEPANGFEHYSERLVLLPNLGIRYEPVDVGVTPVDRTQLGLGEADCVFLCCQSLFKYLPQHDELLARIAARAPNARFVLIAHASNAVTDVMRRRLARAFGRFGLSWTDRCRFVMPLQVAHFQGLLRASDVFLDSVGWSGGNTTLEAMEVGLPIITLPTDTMRGRHAAAILTCLGLPDGIAWNADQYVALAVMLAADPGRRRSLSEQIRAAKASVYGDRTAVRALEAFLNWAVEVDHPADAIAPPEAPFALPPIG
jgi:predicted O-linked N-acetylglucosamine transferase (SPINDLY family)